MTRPDWPAIEARPATRYGRDDAPWMREPRPSVWALVWRASVALLWAWMLTVVVLGATAVPA